jgi:membrane associated rhomboid family serine protease
VPLSDRDYMRSSPPPNRRSRRPADPGDFNLDPIWTLIALNFVFFLATSIRGSLIDALGLSPVLFPERPWTIISSMFVHENFYHIFGNMLTLFFFGRVLYQIVGQNRFLAVYFIGGIVGNLLFILLAPPLSLVIGASGAIYAVAGALAVLMPKMRVMMWFIAPMPLWVVVLVFFVLWSFVPGVAWQAHIGGLATGLLAGLIFRRSGRYYYYR